MGGFGFLFRALPASQHIGLALTTRSLELPTPCAGARNPPLAATNVSSLKVQPLMPTMANLVLNVASTDVKIAASSVTVSSSRTCE